MRLRDRLIKGTVLNFIAVAFNQGSTLIVNILVARILMKEVFGEYAMVQSTLLTVATLSQLATGYTASKYIAEYRTSDPVRAGRVMGLCALVSAMMACAGTIVLIMLAPWLAAVMLNAPQLSLPLIIGAGFLFFSSINGYQIGALSGLEAYGSLAKAGAVNGIVAVAAISLGAWWGGLNGTLIGLSLSAFVRFAVYNIWLRTESRIQSISPLYRGSLRQEKAIIYKFALPAAIAGYYSLPMIWLANSFLVRQPDGYGEMALFSAANNIRVLVLFLPNVMNSVGLSVLNNEKAKGDFNHYNRVFRTNVLYMSLISLSGVLVMGFLGPSILQLFGRGFKDAHLILWMLLFASMFESISIALYQYVQSQARLWLSFVCIAVPRDTLLLVIAYYIIPVYGGAGLAGAYIGSNILGLTCILFLVAILYKESKALNLTASVKDDLTYEKA